MAIGTVTLVTGTVTALSADGGRRILQVGDRIEATDILETADGASLVVALDDGGSLDMGGNDRMALGDALPDGSEITGNGQAQASGPSVEDIQAALLAGQDPTKVADPTAAGAPAAGGGPGAGNEGHGVVSIDYLNPVAPVNNGFDTIGPVVAFNDIAPQVLLLDPRRLAATADGVINQPPVAVDDGSSGLPAGTPVTLDVLGNDSDPDGSLDPSSVQIVGTAAPGQSLTVAGEGVWSVDPVSGAITFTPAEGFVGDPTPIQYSVADNLGLRSDPATVSIDYNRPPEAGDDKISGLTPGSSATLTVLTNDSDPDGSLDPSSVQIVGTAAPGQSLTVAGEGVWSVDPVSGAITFTPAAGFVGDPTPIQYTVADNLGLRSEPATVSVDYDPAVTSLNLAVDESDADRSAVGAFTIDGAAPASVTLAATGATWNPATQTLTDDGGKYTVTVASGSYTFTLLEPLAHTGTGNPLPFDISASLTAADGSSANTGFTVTVYDDGPSATNAGGQLKDSVGEALTKLIDYDLGFDGLGSVTLTLPEIITSGAPWSLTSGADAVSFAVADTNGDRLDELYAFVDKGPQGLDASDRMVFTLMPTQNGSAVGDYSLTLYQVLDLPPSESVTLGFGATSTGPAGQVAVGNSLLVTGGDVNVANGHIGIGNASLDKGESITYQFGTVDNFDIATKQLVNSVQLQEFNTNSGADAFRWTAYRDGAVVGSKTVSFTATAGGDYAPAITVDGGYDTLKIQVISGGFEVGGLKYLNLPNTQQLDLKFGFTATDGDGDGVSGNFTVETGSLLATQLHTPSGLLAPDQSLAVAGLIISATASQSDPTRSLAGSLQYGTITVTPGSGFVGDPAVYALDLAVDESNATRSVTGSFTIDGAAPASVTLAATGATWNPATQTLTDDGGNYTVKVENGNYTFTLLEPLAHTGTGNQLPFDFSATLTSADGASINSGFSVVVYDDGPILTNTNGQVQDSAGQVLPGLIHYDLGFDGLGGVTLDQPQITTNGAPWSLTSGADSVSFAVADTNGDRLDELYAFVDKGPQGLDASDRMVFTLTPTQNDSAVGDYKLTLYQLLDLPPAESVTLGFGATSTGPAGQVAVGNSLLVTGGDVNVANGHIGIGNASLDKGESITYQFGTVDNFDVSTKQLVNSVQLQEFNTNSGADAFRWTAYRDGAVVGSKTVSFTATAGGDYAPAITVDGGYDTLKIQVISGGFEVGGLKYLNLPNTQQLDLKFGFTATDGDGDSVAGSFTVDTGALLTTQLHSPASVLEHPDSLHALSTP